MRNCRWTNAKKMLLKQLIFCLTVFFFTNVAYGEEPDPDLGKFNQENGKGYKIAGICLASVGGACIVTAIPLFVSANKMAEEHSMIDCNIRTVFGGCFSIGGLLFGGVSIPFFIKYKKLNKGLNASFNFGPNNVNMICDF